MTTPTHPRVLVAEYTEVDADEFELRDLRRLDQCLLTTRGIDHVYALAADVGGYTGEFGLGTYDGCREKVPAALCPKVAAVEPGGEIQVWGDGEQTRSFCHVDDCVEGIYRLMVSDYREPLNLGSEEMVTVEPTYRWIEKQVTSRRPPWAAAGR